MPKGEPWRHLAAAWDDLGVSLHQLWLRYFSIGGNSPPHRFEKLRNGEWSPTGHDYDHVAHALNEIFHEQGQDHPVSYWDELGG